MSKPQASKLSEAGFSAVMILLAIVMIVGIGAVGYQVHTRSSAMTGGGHGGGGGGYHPVPPPPRHHNPPTPPPPRHGPTPPPPRH